jgi:flavorubredoxin
MGEAFQAVKLTDRVHWVGAIDWARRDFHGYATERGTTYNAYLILGDPVVLIDTVKAPFVDELLARIRSLIDPGRIDLIVSNHSELDHSGGLPRVIAAVKPARVVASPHGAKTLQAHFHWQQDVQVVTDGERLMLGDVHLRFAETPMLHWPDSMFTHLEGDGVLFSNDAFGMHLASSERFVDELDWPVCRHEAAKYYANILLPFSPVVTKLLAKLPTLGYEVEQIAPDHGPVWRAQPERILSLYGEWAARKSARKAIVLYATMWEGTARMAEAIADGLRGGGASARVLPVPQTHRSDIATELLDAGALIVGSPTLNGQIFPALADALVYLKGLKPRGLIGAAFGAYGWSGEAVGQIEQHLAEMKVPLAAEGLRARYMPDAAALMQCRALGEQVAARLRESITE